jgi:hypothetical protein
VSAAAVPEQDPGALAAAALSAAATALAGLSPAQLADLAAGRARLVCEAVDAPRRAAAPVDPVDPAGTAPGPSVPGPRTDVAPGAVRAAPAAPSAEDVGRAVRAIRDLGTPGEVADHLRRHRYPLPALKQIARELGPTVRAGARNRAGLERDIVEGTAGYRTRSAAMSGGAWS